MVAPPDVLEAPELAEIESLEIAESEPPKARVRKPNVAKIYAGRFVAGRRVVVVRQPSGSAPLRCLDFNTPTFAWGYHGGAPEELAIAILHDHIGSSSMIVENRVLQLYRSFVDEIVANFEYGGAWSITEGTVAKWIAAQERRVPSSTAALP